MEIKNEQPIPKKYIQVLLHIAINGAKTKYEIEKETHISHASVFDAVKFFEQKGILEGEQIGKTRIGLPLKKFKLTFFGVCMALKHANPDSNDYGKIIQNWKHVSPWLFGKFDYLVKRVGRQEAQWFFYSYLRDIRKPVAPEEVFEKSVYNTIVAFEENFIYEESSQDWQSNFEKWVQVFKEDIDFRSLIMEFIDDGFKYAKKYLEWTNFLKNKMQNL